MSRWLLFLCLLTPIWGQSPLTEASALFVAEDYVAAKQLLEKELAETDSLAEAANLYFGLGVCAYRSGDLPESIRCFRSCLARNPDHQAGAFNLSFAEERLFVQDRIDDPQEAAVGLLELLHSELGFYGLIALQLLLIVGVILLRRQRVVLTVLGLILVVVVAATVKGESKTTSVKTTEAVVGKSGAELRIEPHTSHPTKLRLLPGVLVVVKSKTAKWAEVRQGGVSGWVDRRQLAFVE
ncbi:MAG: hypothetical protein ACI97A_003959 [Planctomycetota bacterium]|jgi:hypothetical protein